MNDLKKELIDKLEEYNIDNYYKDLDEIYNDLYNLVIDYMNESQDWSLEYLFEDFIDYSFAEERAKYELENGGLIRLYYFLGDANLNNSLFRIDGYGNLEDINRDDLKTLKEEILDELKEN
jgi:hypothetical protein